MLESLGHIGSSTLITHVLYSNTTIIIVYSDGLICFWSQSVRNKESDDDWEEEENDIVNALNTIQDKKYENAYSLSKVLVGISDQFLFVKLDEDANQLITVTKTLISIWELKTDNIKKNYATDLSIKFVYLSGGTYFFDCEDDKQLTIGAKDLKLSVSNSDTNYNDKLVANNNYIVRNGGNIETGNKKYQNSTLGNLVKIEKFEWDGLEYLAVSNGKGGQLFILSNGEKLKLEIKIKGLPSALRETYVFEKNLVFLLLNGDFVKLDLRVRF